jgi:hypothetical protein
MEEMTLKLLNKIIDASLFNPSYRKAAQDKVAGLYEAVDRQAKRILELELKLQECEGSDNTLTGQYKEAGFSSDGTM